MKSIVKTNTSEVEKAKMTLKDYFFSLPEAKEIAPRKNLTDRIAARCGVSASTVRAWLAYGSKPRDPKVIEILADETGIAPEDMWEDNRAVQINEH